MVIAWKDMKKNIKGCIVNNVCKLTPKDMAAALPRLLVFSLLTLTSPLKQLKSNMSNILTDFVSCFFFTAMVMPGQSVHLITLFPGQA